MGDTILEESIFQKIVDSSAKLKSGFNKYLKKICTEHNFNFDNGFELGIDTMIEELIFGIESKSDNLFNTAKVDYSKNKNLIKTIILNNIYNPDALDVIKDIIVLLEEYTEFVFNTVQDIYVDNSKNKLIVSFIDVVENIAWTTSHMRSIMINLKKLIRDVKENNTEMTDVSKFMKQDSLKRYYFHHVYDLKDKVKIFDNKHMMFGETNNIMFNFDKVMDYIFEEFSGMYIFINSNAKSYLKYLQTNKK